MVVSLNYCSQNGGNLYRAPYYNGNPNIGPCIIGNLDQYPCTNVFFCFFYPWAQSNYVDPLSAQSVQSLLFERAGAFIGH